MRSIAFSPVDIEPVMLYIVCMTNNESNESNPLTLTDALALTLTDAMIDACVDYIRGDDVIDRENNNARSTLDDDVQTLLDIIYDLRDALNDEPVTRYP